MIRRLLAGAFLALAVLTAGMVALDRLCPPDLSRFRAVGAEVDDRNGRVIAFLPTKDGMWRLPATANSVPPLFLQLLLDVEDRRFYRHCGIDPLAIGRAAWQDLRAGRVVSGGSTLTMQVARLLERRPRTLRAKIVEAFRAVQLEVRFSKRDILGMWLTLAPFGGNLEGVRAASYAWFGHSPGSLTAEEAALLVALPRRPEALRPDRHPEAAEAARAKLLAAANALPAEAGIHRADAPAPRLGQTSVPPHDGSRLSSGKTISPDCHDPAPVPRARLPLPRAAPQLVANLARQSAAPTIATTIDFPLQQAMERLASDQLPSLPRRTSLALLVADAPSREIRALVSGAPWDMPDRAERAAWLDLSRAVRSPGSALKPFIYAMAFADGYVGPATPMPDLPEHFGGYAPEDFSHAFAGPVTAADALRRSLNLPAVELLRRIGPLRFQAALGQAGAPLRLPPGAAASLPLALGGAGTTLRDMAGLYAALATDGSAAPLAIVPTAARAVQPFLEPQAARAVAGILTRPLPEGGSEGVAWKTGTTWGGRDAWALGFDARHVVGVWVGRPDGTPMPDGTGGTLALPIMARIFAMLPPAPRHPANAGGPTAALAGARPLPQPALAKRPDPEALRLLFPPPGAVLEAGASVPVRAMGGRRPLSFLIDGAPIASDRVRRDANWTPASPGFYRLTVIDAEGKTANAQVRVE